MYRNFVIIVFSILLAGAVLAPNAFANTGNKQVLFTVRQPVEIPGTVLGPGQYDLQLLSFGGHVAGVWSANRQKFYGFIPTTPVSRMHGINKVRVELGRPHDGIARVKEWFYPGDNYGYRLVYPSAQQKHLARRTGDLKSNG